MLEKLDREEYLGRSEELYRLLLDHVRNAVIATDLEGRIVYWNKYAEKLYQWTAEEVLGQSIFSVTVPVASDALAHEIMEGIANVGHWEGEFVVRRKDGSTFCAQVRDAVIADAEGRIRGYVGVSTDVTERKSIVESAQRARARAEAAERRSAFLAQASAILASSLDYETTLATVSRLVVPEVADWCAVHVIEKDGSIQPLAVSHVDPSKVAVARELQDRYPLDPMEERGVTKAIRTGQPELFRDITDELLVEATRDSEQLRVLRALGIKSAMVVPMVVQGRALGAISFIAAESGRRYGPEDLSLAEDLAHRAALAVDNARLYQDAQEANRVKDEFLATLSHELRTPLTAVIGWTQLLTSGQLDEAATARALQTIQRNARAQSQIIEDILDVSRIISGKLKLDPRPVEIVPVIEAAMDAVRPAAAAKAIQLQPAFAADVNLVPCDPHRMQQVIWNLLSNAVKFTPPGGRVSIQLGRSGADAQIRVSDTGPGIAPEFLPYVFDRFRQADGSTTRMHGGLGLGLAIVRHLVELHGGTVQAESAGAGHGAAFTVNLPLSPKAQAPSVAEPATSAQTSASKSEEDGGPSLQGLSVLVVDDETDTLDYVAAALRERGAEVTAASSAAEAMTALERLRPDVLVADIAMPGEDGYALIKRVRALDPAHGGNVPAAALTAYASSEDRRRVLLSGFQIHLPKPVEPAELAAVVASLAGRTIKNN
ncbi:MAG TPA: ATP-binding protein [Pyrinomonadaceae bacterium]|jgi:PAS domain S-box-containing protein